MELSMIGADKSGQIYDDPDLLMVMDRAGQWCLPKAGEVIPLPAESELFLMPGRKAVGLDPATGKTCISSYTAVAAFPAPAYTISAHPACVAESDAPVLPLFAYGAVGYGEGRFWVAAARVDADTRQQFAGISRDRIARNARQLLRAYPRNRLVGHIINNCVLRYDCPAARNFALGRYEAPLPTSRSCNAACLGCISLQGQSSPINVTPQCRLAFTPSPLEIAEVMFIHAEREKKCPVYSFGQGCEGDPLQNYELLCEATRQFRKGRGKSPGPGTVNCNTNASNPVAVEALAKAGLTSLRVSLNSATPEYYSKYYRPANYDFENVRESIRIARANDLFVSLNLLYFPGFSDTEPEIQALAELCGCCGVSMIQLRNLNIDPAYYRGSLGFNRGDTFEQPCGLKEFQKKIARACPWLKFGYFNPYLGDKAVLEAPQAR